MPLTILMGDYGSGKTTTAKYLVKQNGGSYLDVDMLSSGNKYDDVPLLDKLREIIKPGIEYYIDGFPSGNYYGVINEATIGTPVKYIVCLTEPGILAKRQVIKNSNVETILPRSYSEIRSVVHLSASIAMTYDPDPVFIDTTTKPLVFIEKKGWMLWWMELNLYSSLRDAGEYQDIELPHNTITGLSKSFKTWQRISALIDFNGRSVVDYGCNYGYFSFKAEEAGAVNVVGIDESDSIINTAASIAMVKGSRARFIKAKLQDVELYNTDIVMALNVLHHLEYDKGVVKGIFKSAGTIILEMPVKDVELISETAGLNGFLNPVIASSHREGRAIVIYSKEKPISLPKKYVYRPRVSAIMKWIFYALRKFIPSSKIPGVARVKRYIWLRIR